MYLCKMLSIFCISVLILGIVQSQSLDEVCKLQHKKFGVCTLFSDCDYAVSLVQIEKKRPQHCDGFEGLEPVVCCPREKSEIVCNRYYPKTFGSSVFGGTEARPKEFGHMAAIGYGRKQSIKWLCGGSLISEQFVLTAAHCVQSLEFGFAKWVRLGDLDLVNTTDDARPQDFTVSKQFVHPNYTISSHYHDIALLKLNKKAIFNDYVKPACLHISTTTPQVFSVTGWGKTDFLGESSSHLLTANVFLIDNKKCKTIYSNASKRKLKNGIVDDLQICAGHPEGKDTCPGDSGGPLQYKFQDYFKIVGITSFGKVCGVENSAGVYTRVSHFQAWIEAIVWPRL